MQNLKSLLQHALLALALVAGAAVAGPTYHVALDTNAYSGMNGYLALAAGTVGTAPDAELIVTGLPGASGAVTLHTTASDSWASDLLALGGVYGFDVTFGGDYQSGFGSDQGLLSLFLMDETMTQFLGNPAGSVADFIIATNTDEGPASVTPVVNGGDVTVAEASNVPEASQWAVFFTGLGLMTWTLRRRQQR